MFRIKIFSLMGMFGALLIGLACDQKSTNPEKNQVQFQLEMVYQKSINGPLLIMPPTFSSKGSAKFAFSLSDYNLARVMVMDFSEYQTWTDVTETDEWAEYVTARDEWYNTGNTLSWAEWRGFLGDFFQIITDQNLTIESDHAIGMVAGAIGLNRIVVALTNGDEIVYWGEGDAIGSKDEMYTARIYVYYMGNDPCLQKSMENSPEEAVFDEAFGE